MRKFFLFPVFVLFVLNLISCVQSNEDKINVAFKDYVQKNFDDPSSLVEVVSIEPSDTISTKQLKRLYHALSEKYDSLKNMGKRMNDSIMYNMFKNEQQLRTNAKFQDALIKYRDVLERKSNFHLRMMDPIVTTDCLLPSQFDEMRDTLVYSSTIKYRLKKSGELKLEEIKVYCDSNYINFTFGNQSLEKNDFLKTFFNSYKKSCDFTVEMIDLEEDVLIKGNELLDIVRSNIK